MPCCAVSGRPLRNIMASSNAIDRRRAAVVVLALLLAAALSFVWRPQRTYSQARAAVPLEQIFLAQFGEWSPDLAGSGLTISAREGGKRYEMYSQVLERAYINRQGQRIMLSVAYGEQSGSVQMHRPEVCYRASGFKVNHTEPMRLDIGPLTLSVTRVLAQTDRRIEPITYWTVLGDHVYADGRSQQWAQLSAGLRGQILDGMLVRISSIDQDTARAYALQEGFARALFNAVPAAYRQRVFGQATTP